jgi:hypothetical protein
MEGRIGIRPHKPGFLEKGEFRYAPPLFVACVDYFGISLRV